MKTYRVLSLFAIVFCFSAFAHAKNCATKITDSPVKDSIRVSKGIQGLIFFSLPKAEEPIQEQKGLAPITSKELEDIDNS